MSIPGVLQVALFVIILLLLSKPLGLYLVKVYEGERTWLTPVLGPIERGAYRLAGVDPAREQSWLGYAAALLLQSLVSAVALYLLQRLQGVLPLNPQRFGPVAPDLAFNTAVSFVTNTNWQSFSGESTMSYLSQMSGLAVQNFVSAATGMAVAFALVRGLARRSAHSIGNYWVDLMRGTLYVLLPICLPIAIVSVALGMPQNFNAYTEVATVEGGTQLIAQGPVASQEVIKLLGTNGGGFFNANAAHPYENPNGITNFINVLLIVLIPAAIVYAFGTMVGDTRQGWAIWAAMAVLLLIGLAVALPVEQSGNPLFRGVDQSISTLQVGGNFEGKETRFGIGSTILFAVVTTAASCGAINAMHASLLPITGLVTLVNMQLGEVIFGGAGAGLYGMLIFAILAVFIAGLMVGRTPEYLGKKIEPFEMKMVTLVILVLSASILLFSGMASVLPAGLVGLLNQGPHGLSEMLYAYSSATGNNGSAFAGLSANSLWYNTTLGLAMLIGRFLMIVPVLAIAGALAAKRRMPESLGTFPTHGPLFIALLASTVLIVGALSYFPALALSPIVEHLLLAAGVTF